MLSAEVKAASSRIWLRTRLTSASSVSTRTRKLRAASLRARSYSIGDREASERIASESVRSESARPECGLGLESKVSELVEG